MALFISITGLSAIFTLSPISTPLFIDGLFQSTSPNPDLSILIVKLFLAITIGEITISPPAIIDSLFTSIISFFLNVESSSIFSTFEIKLTIDILFGF